MPLPDPRRNEERDKFIKRFMADPTANRDFPDNSQRYAVAIAHWKAYLANNRK